MNTFVSFVIAPATKLLELFVDVELIGIGSKTRLSEDDAQWLHLGNMADSLDIYFLVEASYESSFIHDVQMLSCNFLLAKRIAKFHASIHHTTEKQVQFCAIVLHTIHQRKEIILSQLSRLEIYIFHI